MIKSSYKVIGVMSGTSLDGIDIVCSTYSFNGHWEFKINKAMTFPYSARWRKMLSDLPNESMEFLQNFDEDYSVFLADNIRKFIDVNKIKNIDFVASHGHTALHQPEKKLTYQIGNRQILADILNLKVVCDFRVQDVELDGQGAPLVPIGDALLFPEYEYCLNLGGFANISTEINCERIAYDICPVNIVLNYYCRQIDLDYDNKGQLALTGKIHQELFEQLNQLDYYKQPYPKSLGLEWVNTAIFPAINFFKLDVKDVLRTFVAHIAHQIANEINKKQQSKILVTGGGVYNTFLVNEIKKITDNDIIVPNQNLIEYKESLIFGLLGVLRIRNEINCLKSVTGASKDHSSGKIYVP